MSKRSTNNELDCVCKSRMARNHCSYRSQMQPWPSKSAHKSSNSGESVMKKEIADLGCFHAAMCVLSQRSGSNRRTHLERLNEAVAVQPADHFRSRVRKGLVNQFATEPTL